MKKSFELLLNKIMRRIPFSRVHQLMVLWMGAQSDRDPKMNLINLFALDDEINREIDKTTFKYEKDQIHSKHRLTKYHDFFVDKLSPGERVLDIGCGYGAVAFSMASRAGAWVTGIDLSATNIAKAKTNYQHPNLEFIQGDALIYLPEKPFDTIVISNVLEHIENRSGFLVSVQEKISPKRWLVRLPMFNRHWTVPLRKELGIAYYSDPTHFTEYTTDSFREEVGQANMKIADLQINWGEIWAEIRYE